MSHDGSRILIRTEKLCKSYRVGNELKDAVRDADLRIRQGEFIVIQGLYGLQKNVFFNLVGCLEKPTSGKYYFDYEDIALADNAAMDSFRKLKLGYLFRNYNLIGRLTVLQNIELPMQGLNISVEEKQDRLQRALKRFDIEGISGEAVYRLSDYQKQLVSLARAVINQPLLIFADEPAANLNGREEQELMEHLQGLNQEGMAIMLITGREAVRALESYRLIRFENGRISEDRGVHKLSPVRREA